jgi:hypothetical protein
MQQSQSKILQMITNAPWYVTNQTLHDDVKEPFIKDVIQEKSINHHDKLGNQSHLATTTGTATKKKAKETLASGPN